MKSKLFILLLLSTTAHASRVEPPTEGECRYQNLSTRANTSRKRARAHLNHTKAYMFSPRVRGFRQRAASVSSWQTGAK